MPETTARFHHMPERPASDFAPGSYVTLRAGSHRVVLGRLKGETRKGPGGRPRLTVQKILHPRSEMIPGCTGCARARRFYGEEKGDG